MDEGMGAKLRMNSGNSRKHCFTRWGLEASSSPGFSAAGPGPGPGRRVCGYLGGEGCVVIWGQGRGIAGGDSTQRVSRRGLWGILGEGNLLFVFPTQAVRMVGNRRVMVTHIE